ncbi:MAG: hypothetical protein II719_00375, partial [Clostridia bacterium]|nr:hypothetical protein [Clostridia bacterium]
MTTYLARLSMSNSFSEKALENAGEPIRRLAEELSKRCTAEMTLDRFTYGVFKVTASSMEEAENIVKEAWASLYPDAVNDVRVFVALCDGTDQAQLMRQIYTGLYGSDSYLELTTDLAREIPVLAERGALGALRKQNYLFAVDSGCGMTTLLSSFGNFLQRMKAFDDSESRSYFLEYNVQKSAEGDAKTPDDVISALDNADKEKDYSSVGLNIEGFLEGSDFGPLRDFVRRLYRFQDRYVFVFRVPFLEKKALDQVAEALSDLALLKVVEIPPLSDVLLLEFLLDHMRRNGYEPDLSVTDAFFARIRAEKKDGRFYGFKTAEKIVNSMILEKARHDAEASARGEETNRTKLTGDDIGEMAQDKKKKSGYEELREMIGMEVVVVFVFKCKTQI